MCIWHKLKKKKLAQKLRDLTTQDMRMMKCGKIQKFSVALKIWLKKMRVLTLRTSKGWNLTKSRKILICVANLTQKWDWPLWTCGGWNLAKSRNFDMCQKFSSKLTFVTQHKQMRDMLARAMCTLRSKFVKFLIMTVRTYSSWSISLVAWKHGQKSLFTCYVVCLCHWLAY